MKKIVYIFVKKLKNKIRSFSTYIHLKINRFSMCFYSFTCQNESKNDIIKKKQRNNEECCKEIIMKWIKVSIIKKLI